MAEAKYIGGQRICDLTARERLDEYAEIFTGNVDEAVQNWLDEHPEATTSVADGSLTYRKLVTGTLGYVTPEMFGAKGDGVTDDSAAIIAAINTGLDVYGTKTYGIGSAIHALFEPSQNILINLKALSVMDYMLWIDAKGSAWTQLLHGSFDIIANCAEKAENGIRYDRCRGAKMTFNVMNCLGTGVTGRYTSNLSCGGNTVSVYVNNINTSATPTTSVALRAGRDDHYPFVSSTDTNVCVCLEYGGNDFGIVHPWCTQSARVSAGATCIFVKTNEYNNFENITSDTMKSVFKFSPSFLYPKIAVTGNFVVYNNSNVYSGKTALVEIDGNIASTGEIRFYTSGISDIKTKGVYYGSIEWYDGTVPKILYADGITDDTTIEQARSFAIFTVINKAFSRTEAVKISSIVNAAGCYVPISEISTGNYVIDSERVSASDYFVQKIESERGSAERRILRNGTVLPWANNSISTRTTSRTIAISSGATSATIDTSAFLYLTPGSILFATVDFMNVPKPDGMIVNTASKSITLTFPAEWSQLYNGDITVVITAVFNMPTLN